MGCVSISIATVFLSTKTLIKKSRLGRGGTNTRNSMKKISFLLQHHWMMSCFFPFCPKNLSNSSQWVNHWHPFMWKRSWTLKLAWGSDRKKKVTPSWPKLRWKKIYENPGSPWPPFFIGWLEVYHHPKPPFLQRLLSSSENIIWKSRMWWGFYQLKKHPEWSQISEVGFSMLPPVYRGNMEQVEVLETCLCLLVGLQDGSPY